MTRKHTAVFGWCLALLVSAGFAALGHWQLQRMHSKQALLDRAAHVRDTTLPLGQALATPNELAWVRGSVRFLPQLVLLDNQLHDGRAGVRVYQLAAPEGVSTGVLVDLGWLPLPADRQLPGIVALKGVQTVQGLLSAPPSAGLAIGPALAPGLRRRPGWPPDWICRSYAARLAGATFRRRSCAWTLHCRLATHAIWTCCQTPCRPRGTWVMRCNGSGWPLRSWRPQRC